MAYGTRNGDQAIEVRTPDVRDVTTRVELGAALEQLRARSGLTLRELSRRINETGDSPIGPSALGDWCRGTRLPQSNRSGAFTRLLGLLGVEDHAPWFDALSRARARSGALGRGGHVPYPGLRSFGPGEAEWFFGREELVGDTAARFGRVLADGERHRLLWVVGPSGAGKTSLLHAGLVPRLESAGHPCLSMTPGARPMERLAELLADHLGDDRSTTEEQLRRDPAGWVVDTDRRRDSGDPTVVVLVDQFEELLRECDEEAERASFLAAMEALTAPSRSSGHALVVGLRVDFYAAVATRSEFVSSLQDAQVLVGPMNATQLTTAIVEPARQAGVSIDRSLVALLLREFVSHGAIGGHHDPGALPLLAHALRETWGLAERGRMTAEDYVRAGGVARAVEESAERVYSRLNARSRVLIRQVFIRLLHVGDDGVATRRVVSAAELDGLSPVTEGGPGGTDSGELVGRFVDARLLTAGETTVEIAHESLLVAWPRLRSWIDEDRELLRTHRKITEAARAWAESGGDSSMLASGARLDEMTAWARSASPSLHLNQDELSFIASSRDRAASVEAARRRQTRRLRVLVAAAAVFAVLAATFGVSTNQARSDAVTARDQALSRKLAVDARSLRDTDPTLAAQLAAAGYRIAPTIEARSAVVESSVMPMAERRLGGRDVTALALSGDGGLLAVSDSSNGRVRLLIATPTGFALAGSVVVAGPTREIYAVALAPDGRTLAVGDSGAKVSLWDVSDPGTPRSLGPALPGPQGPFAKVAISPDGRELAVAGESEGVLRWAIDDPSKPSEASLLPSARGTTSVAYSHDGDTLAIGDNGGHVELWDVGGPPRVVADLTVGDDMAIHDVAFAPGDTTLVSGTGNGARVTVWDISSLARPRQLDLPANTFESWVNTTVFSADGAFLAAGSSDQELRVWDTATWTPVLALPHPAQVSQAVFLPDHPILVSGAEDGVMRTWDLRTIGHPRVAGKAWFLSFTSDGTSLAAFSGEETRIWDMSEPSATTPGTPVPSRGDVSGGGDMTSDGRLVALGTREGQVELVDVTDRESPQPVGDPLGGSRELVETAAFSPDDTLLAAGGGDTDVRVWDIRAPDRPTLVARLGEPSEFVYGVDWSPTRPLLAVAGADDLVHLYDLGDPSRPRYLAHLGGQESDTYSAVFSPDGNVVAVGGSDGVVVLWDVSSPTEPERIGEPMTGPGARVMQLAFDADGRRLAAGVVDGTTWLWDVSDIEHPTTTAVLEAGSRVNAVAFRPSDDTLASAGHHGEVQLWSSDTEAALRDICAGSGDAITAVEWARYIQGASYDPPCAAAPP